MKVEPHQHNVGTCYRCHSDVEPIISAQWFVKMAPLAKEAIRVVEEGETKFVPDRFSKTYLNWMENVHDWCISCQLWWGHQIPVWYCDDCGHMTVSRRMPPSVRSATPRTSTGIPTCWTPGSPALWPFSHPGLARGDRGSEVLLSHRRAGHRLRHHLLLGGPHDLLRLRADQAAPLPHRVHPRPGPDDKGRKMSKSLGNGIDPWRSPRSTAPTPCASTWSPATAPATTCASTPSGARPCATLPTRSGTPAAS